MSDDVSSRLRVITPAASEPVTLSEAKLFLRIEHTADDEAVTRAIIAARQAAEQFLKCALLPQMLEYTVGLSGVRRVALPVGPATAINEITVTGCDGTEREIDETLFRLSVDGYAVFFDPIPSGEFLTISYAASTADNAANLPSLVKQGILHHMASMMDREGDAAMPLAALQCYQPFRRIAL